VLTVATAAVLTATPIVWYIKGKLENPFLDRLAFFVARRVLFLAAANRDDAYPALVRLFDYKIGIVGTGVDLDVIRDCALCNPCDELRLGPGPTVGYLGPLYEPKGVHHLVEAFARVASGFPTAVLVIVGDVIVEEYRPYLQQLHQLVARYGLTNRTVFTGWRDDALAVMKFLSIIVQPSRAEGFSRTVLEAMALERAVIASRVGGHREAIRHGENGLLFDPGDVEQLANCLRILLSDPALRARLGSAARKTMAERYDASGMVRQLTETFAEVANKGPHVIAP
jgi:glycosyltransferase involved in cell wall biosynthesis